MEFLRLNWNYDWLNFWKFLRYAKFWWLCWLYEIMAKIRLLLRPGYILNRLIWLFFDVENKWNFYRIHEQGIYRCFLENENNTENSLKRFDFEMKRFYWILIFWWKFLGIPKNLYIVMDNHRLWSEIDHDFLWMNSMEVKIW